MSSSTTINTNRARALLRSFDFKKLFVEELGWNHSRTHLPPAQFDGIRFTLTALAEQGGMLIAECQSSDGNIPPSGMRAKIDQHLTSAHYEHILIFIDHTRQTSLWRWVKREQGKGGKVREHTYRFEQPGDALLQKLAGIAFELKDLDEDGRVSIGEVTARVARAFDLERVTKRFYDQFQSEHRAFLGFLKGVQDVHGRDWYASVMLNRLMFLYFIQKKGFLNGDSHYLRTQLKHSQKQGADRYYHDFLRMLFFKGLACEPHERTDSERRLLGSVPYLNGGIFLPHQIEEANPDIEIADAAFERLFDFFDRYTWHLDDRELRADNEINPDVLGYIFEKYINQKQMGAYYTKEDITNYICKNTILPFLLDKVGLNVAQAMGDVAPYIYEAVSTEAYLPTETEREYAARRKRYEQIRTDFAAGQISTVNDLITYNLDLQAFTEDFLRGPEMTATPVMLRRFYEALTHLTVLDPTCGSGAFLFAAMNILEPLYELCLDKMQQVVGRSKPSPLTPLPHGEGNQTSPLAPLPHGEGNQTSVVSFPLPFAGERGQGVEGTEGKTLTYSPPPLTEAARRLRKEQTSAESLLWECLRDYRLHGLKFRRQHPIKGTPHIADFYCNQAELIIELDGEIHRTQQKQDYERQRMLEEHGYRVIRFANRAVFDDLEGVLKDIWEAAQPSPLAPHGGENQPSPLAPLPHGEGNQTNTAFSPLPLAGEGGQGDEGTPNQGVEGLGFLSFFHAELARVNQHPNRRYFVLKSIIVNNLYGVDIMDEAVEICKLRLFLKLVAQVDDVRKVEPLPDIDFNIRAGNTLVGFATKEEITFGGGLWANEATHRIETLAGALHTFRQEQLQGQAKAATLKTLKQAAQKAQSEIAAQLDKALFELYGAKDFAAWRGSHKPFHWYAEFNGVMANGGFDVIVGNPPYVEYSKVKEYTIRGYEAETSRNLYAFTMERAATIQKLGGRFGVIVPSGAFSVHETVTLRSVMLRCFPVAWLSGYAIRPAKLFDGVDQRLAIFLAHKGANVSPTVFSTRYHHWYSEEREELFSLLAYTDVSKSSFGNVYPKAGNQIALSIIDKVLQQTKTSAAYLNLSNGTKLHYHRSPRYWIRAMDFEQYFKSPTRDRSIHHFRDLYVISNGMAKFIGAVVNSSLFFFWFITIGNGRNLTGDDVKTFPIGTPSDVTRQTVGELFDQLMRDYKKNSVVRVRRDQEYQEFNQALSKPIIDEIDRVLAQHYGFTDEELDFIINYDIKYRMGKDAESGEEAE